MATWEQVGSVVRTLGDRSERASDTMWVLTMPVGEDRTQRIFIGYDVMPAAPSSGMPDLEIIKIQSAVTLVTDVAAVLPISAIAEGDLRKLLQDAGQMMIGDLGFIDHGDDTGQVTLGTTFPLRLLDLSNPLDFLSYLALVAGCADNLERTFASKYGKAEWLPAPDTF